jgi:hypothetical protein
MPGSVKDEHGIKSVGRCIANTPVSCINARHRCLLKIHSMFGAMFESVTAMLSNLGYIVEHPY